MAGESPAKRFILVGLDGVGMESMLHMVEAGYMPNVGRLIKRGVHREMWGVLPTLTPPGWTTLATGAWPGTHQVMDFNIRALGKPLDQTEWGINYPAVQGGVPLEHRRARGARAGSGEVRDVLAADDQSRRPSRGHGTGH